MARDFSSDMSSPITEDSYSVTRTIDGKPYLLSLTDTAGQEEYRSLWASSNLRSDAFLLVYDITSPSSLYDTLPHFMQMIDMEADNREDNGAVPPIKILAGNKCDLKEARKISATEGLEWARARGCGFMETSARECVNVEETFACEYPTSSPCWPASALTVLFLLGLYQLLFNLYAFVSHAPRQSELIGSIAVIVRRVVEARRMHGVPSSQKAANGANAYAGNSFSRTEPLTPLNEKGGRSGYMDPEGNPGQKTGKTPWWARLKCW